MREAATFVFIRAITWATLFVGFLLGAIVTWIGDRRRRRETRLLNRRTAELEKSLDTAQKQIGDLERKLADARPQQVPTAA